MPSVREIKRRITSVKNIGQVTRALEAVSASRARRAQLQAEGSRAYAEKAWEILMNLTGQPGGLQHPLLRVPEQVETVDIVLITSDRGLAGAYNMNVIRVAEDFVRRQGENVQVRWITVGRKGRDYLIRRRRNVVAEFSHLPAEPSYRDIQSIGDLIVGDFLAGVAQQVFIAYTDYVNVLAQRPVVVNLLPLVPYHTDDSVAGQYVKAEPEVTVSGREYLYEPSAAALLDEIVPRFTGLNIYQAVLESFASEHAARMVAMRNASENASELVDDLTLEYNKARQLAITSEILDIVGGVEALKGSKKGAQISEQFEIAKGRVPGKAPQQFIANTVADAEAVISSAAQKAGAARDSVLSRADAFIQEIERALKPDDSEQHGFTVIEGIGAKIEGALHASGITTFAQLASTSAADLERIVREQGVRMVGTAETWARQAQYIVERDLEGLREYQARLTSGREEE